MKLMKLMLLRKRHPKPEPKPRQNHLQNRLGLLLSKSVGVAINEHMINGNNDVKTNDGGTMIVGTGDLLCAFCHRHCLQLHMWT